MIITKLLSFVFVTAAVMFSVASAAVMEDFPDFPNRMNGTRRDLRQLAITHMQQQDAPAQVPADPAAFPGQS